MLLQQLDTWATHVLDAGGLKGAGFLMALESMVFPIPSEIVMPPLGSLVQQGHYTWTAAIVATSIGSLIGSLLSYAIGYFGGKPAIHKVGKYVFLNDHHLDQTTSFFTHYGGFTVFISRFIPVVRHLISIPAGIARMPIVPFCVYTLIGATMWNTLLLYLGFKFHQHLDNIKQYSKPLDYGFVALCLGGAFVYYLLHRKKNVPAEVTSGA